MASNHVDICLHARPVQAMSHILTRFCNLYGASELHAVPYRFHRACRNPYPQILALIHPRNISKDIIIGMNIHDSCLEVSIVNIKVSI